MLVLCERQNQLRDALTIAESMRLSAEKGKLAADKARAKAEADKAAADRARAKADVDKATAETAKVSVVLVTNLRHRLAYVRIRRSAVSCSAFSVTAHKCIGCVHAPRVAALVMRETS